MTLVRDRVLRPEADFGSLFEHLAALRRMLIQAVLAILAGVAIAIPVAPRVMGWMKEPLARSGIGDPGTMLKVIEVAGAFTAAMWTVLWTGVILSFPVVIWAVAAFIFPALKVNEKRYVLAAVVLGVLFFAAGVAAGYAWILPLGIRWLYGVNQWFGVDCDFIILKDYLNFAGQLLLALGVAAQAPVLLLILGFMGLVRSEGLRGARRLVVILLMVAAMLITPGGDPVSMLFVTVPLILLYELCILLIWLKEKAVAG